MERDFLPISREDLLQRGWYYYDFLLITGDAYVDHPSFGTASSAGCWRQRLPGGHPPPARLAGPCGLHRPGPARYGVFVNGGNIDSMVAHYTAAKRRRSDDAYTPGGKAARGPTGPAWYTPTWRAGPFPACPWCWAALKPPCGGSAITISGPTPCAAPFLWTPRLTCWSGAWASALFWNVPAAGSRPESGPGPEPGRERAGRNSRHGLA